MSGEKEIRRISDLPYYKEEHGKVLSEMGIETLDELLEALYDDETSEKLLSSLKGVGPKIRDQWIELIEESGVYETVEDEEFSGEEAPEGEEEIEEKAIIEEEEKPAVIEEPEVIEEGGYIAAPKPVLDDERRRLLQIRMQRKSKKPKFRRQEWFRYKRLGEKWRRPKGLHSKMRRKFKYRPPVVSIGYRTPAKVRGLHSSGFEEVLIYNPSQLEGLDPKTQAVRIGATVGYRKRLEIEKRAAELGVHVLNRTG